MALWQALDSRARCCWSYRLLCATRSTSQTILARILRRFPCLYFKATDARRIQHTASVLGEYSEEDDAFPFR